jgi:hypothetical protein
MNTEDDPSNASPFPSKATAAATKASFLSRAARFQFNDASLDTDGRVHFRAARGADGHTCKQKKDPRAKRSQRRKHGETPESLDNGRHAQKKPNAEQNLNELHYRVSALRRT